MELLQVTSVAYERRPARRCDSFVFFVRARSASRHQPSTNERAAPAVPLNILYLAQITPQPELSAALSLSSQDAHVEVEDAKGSTKDTSLLLPTPTPSFDKPISFCVLSTLKGESRSHLMKTLHAGAQELGLALLAYLTCVDTPVVSGKRHGKYSFAKDGGIIPEVGVEGVHPICDPHASIECISSDERVQDELILAVEADKHTTGERTNCRVRGLRDSKPVAISTWCGLSEKCPAHNLECFRYTRTNLSVGN